MKLEPIRIINFVIGGKPMNEITCTLYSTDYLKPYDATLHHQKAELEIDQGL